MKKYLGILAFLSAFGGVVHAQFLDTIQTALSRKARFSFSLNSRNYFITTTNAPILGFMLGVCFDRKIGIGGGANILRHTIEEHQQIEGQYVQTKLHFFFISYYVEYLARITKHWAIDIPVSIGIGNSFFSYTRGGNSQKTDKHIVIPFEPSLEMDYDYSKYWGLFVQAGYQWMLVNNKNIHKDFNSPAYSFGILIYPFEIYTALFPDTGLAHTINDN